jgi:hypothetical protein
MRDRRLQIRYKQSDPEISIVDRSSMERSLALPFATLHSSLSR